MVDFGTLQLLYFGLGLILALFSTVNALNQYDESRMDNLTGEIEEEILGNLFRRFGDIVSDLYNELDTAANYQTTDLGIKADAGSVSEEFVEVARLLPLRVLLNDLNKIQRYNTWNRWGAFYSPIGFILLLLFGAGALFEPEYGSVLWSVGIFFGAAGGLLLLVFLYCRHKIHSLSDEYRRVG